MTGDGLQAPMNAPGGGQPIPGIQPGDEPVTIANRVYIVGPGGGMFVYNPTQAKNNLVETAGITGAMKDKFGNTILPGDTLYMNQGGTYYALQIAGGAGSVPLVHWWVSPTDQTGTYTTLFVVGLAVSAGLNGIDLGSAAAFANPPQCFSNPLFAQNPVTPGSGAETWHNIIPDAGWTVATSLRYKLLPDGLVYLYGDLTHAAITAATSINSVNPLPGPYRPAGTVSVASPLYPAGRCGVEVAATGIIIAEPLGVSCTGVNINGIFPRD